MNGDRELLPPAEFNPTIFCENSSSKFCQVRVECFGFEVASVAVEPSTKPERN